MSNTRNVQPEIEEFMQQISSTEVSDNPFGTSNPKQQLSTLVDLRLRRASNNFAVYELGNKGLLFTVFNIEKDRFGYTVQDRSNTIYAVDTACKFYDIAKAIRFHGSVSSRLKG